jgi:hypothetical protein
MPLLQSIHSMAGNHVRAWPPRGPSTSRVPGAWWLPGRSGARHRIELGQTSCCRGR